MCSLILSLLELFTLYASGQLDGTSSIPDELVSAVINCLIGKSKQEMVRVSTKVKVGEAVSSLGQFIEYLYGKDDTTEEHCPSKKLAEKKGSGMPFTPTAQYARNVDVVIQCHECEKWRLLYAKNVVTRWELEKILEEVQYSCGISLQDIDDESSILCQVFIGTNLLCSSPMEIPELTMSLSASTVVALMWLRMMICKTSIQFVTIVFTRSLLY